VPPPAPTELQGLLHGIGKNLLAKTKAVKPRMPLPESRPSDNVGWRLNSIRTI